jgi:type IV pilus assembly protein PilZ
MTELSTPIAIAIKDLPVLHAAYMLFVKNGGLFIPTKKAFNKDDTLTLLVTLPNEETKFEVKATVVWITPVGAQGARTPGIGVQFEGEPGRELNDKIQKILAITLQSADPTHTM